MKRNIMTGEGKKQVTSSTEFEVSGIKLFTYYNTDWEEWRVTEMSSGFAFDGTYRDEKVAIEYAKIKIANVGPEKIAKIVKNTIDKYGIANEV